MLRAPSLPAVPSVTVLVPRRDGEPGRQAAASTIAPDVALPRAAPAPAPAPGTHDPGPRGFAALQAVAAAHEAYVQEVASLHQQFLGQQHAAARSLLGLAGGPRETPVTVAPRGRVGREVASPERTGVAQPVGARFERGDLEAVSRLARPISSLFGAQFVPQDGHRYQIRLPAPPMLFTDRILDIDGVPGSLGAGRLRAELELTDGMFGLEPAGHASVFMLGEAGQASMLLASWLGADLSHEGEHRYRVLDLDMTVEGPLPSVGDVLRNEVSLDRHAVAGGLRMFFFDARATVAGRPVARGRFTAGLFSESELAEPAELHWNAADDRRVLEGPFTPPEGGGHAGRFRPEALAALREGRVADCFGDSHAAARTHVRTPLAARRELFLLDSVEAFEPGGGPWGRGHLRATQEVTPEDWYFACHLPGDPCLPGFLMLEGAVQSLAFYLTALGCTLERDGWSFAPAPHVRCTCRFRGQVVPQTTTLRHEIFVESLSTGPSPRIVADAVCRLDGRIIFHARRLGVTLVPGAPAGAAGIPSALTG